MQSSHAAMIGLLLIATASEALAQAPPAGKTLAATMNVYVFPNNGQDAAQQSKDEAECYSWAVTNTGTDPFELQKQAQAAQQQAQQQAQQASGATQGAGAKGAVKGAAAGALIGGIADEDKNDAAATGAAVGAIGHSAHCHSRRPGPRHRGLPTSDKPASGTPVRSQATVAAVCTSSGHGPAG